MLAEQAVYNMYKVKECQMQIKCDGLKLSALSDAVLNFGSVR